MKRPLNSSSKVTEINRLFHIGASTRGAEAVRFAIEEFAAKPHQKLILEQGLARFGWNDIGVLYDSPAYPLRAW